MAAERETRRLVGLGQLGFDFRTTEESVSGGSQRRPDEDDLLAACAVCRLPASR